MEKLMAEDRDLWRFGMDRRLLTAWLITTIIIIIIIIIIIYNT